MNLKKNIFNAITIILLAALIAGAVLLNNRIKKLETQMAYTSDNTYFQMCRPCRMISSPLLRRRPAS